MAAAASSTEIVFQPRGPPPSGEFTDPNEGLAKLATYFKRIKPENVEILVEPKGGYINARAKLPSDSYEMTITGPLLSIWPTMYPYGHTRQHYPRQGGPEMQKHAADSLEKARYKCTHWSRAWTPQLADADGNDIHAVEMADWLREFGELARERVWANPEARKLIVACYQGLARAELKKKQDSINEKYAKWERVNKRSPKDAKDIELSAEDLKFRKMSEAEREIFLPTEEQVHDDYFDRAVRAGFNQSFDDKTGQPRYNFNSGGSVFRPISSLKMKTHLMKTQPHHTKEIKALFDSKGVTDEAGHTKAPLGWCHNDVPLITMTKSKTVIPFSQRRTVLGSGSVCAFDWTLDVTPCNKNGDFCVTLVPRRIQLYRQGSAAKADPTADVAHIEYAGAEDIVVPAEEEEPVADEPPAEAAAAPPPVAAAAVAPPPPAAAKPVERVLHLTIEGPPVRKRNMPAATVEEMDDSALVPAVSPARAALEAFAEEPPAEPASPEVVRSPPKPAKRLKTGVPHKAPKHA